MKIERSNAGQGLTEYVIAVVLVALAVLLAVKIYGERVEQQFYSAWIEVGGVGHAQEGGKKP